MKRFICCFFILLICLSLSACSKGKEYGKTVKKGAEHEKSNSALNDLLNSEDWIEIDPPEISSDEWYDANYSHDEYKVEYVDEIRIGKAELKEFIVYGLSEGTFIGTDHGEWGGKLYFYPSNNIYKAYKVMDGNIVDIIGINNQIMVFEGLAHLTLSEGRMLKLIKKDNKWTALETVNLGDAPYAITKTDDDTIYVVTCSKLLKIKDEKISENVIDNAFWECLYPNSVICDKEFVYIGMRKGVAKVNLTTKKISWIIKK